MDKKTLVIALLGGLVIGLVAAVVVAVSKPPVPVVVEQLQAVGRATAFTELALTGASFKYERLTIGSGAITASYTNVGKATEFIDLGSVSSSGTASSSYDYYLIASSSASIPASHNFTDLAPRQNGRILTGTLATSTAATTTNSILGAVLGRSDGVIELKKGESILFALQKGDMNCPSIPAVNGCETASSTSRGFNNLTALFKTYSTSTPSNP